MKVTSRAVDIKVMKPLAPLAPDDHGPPLADGRAAGGQSSEGGEQ
jgi:hypothetical protein